MRYQVITFQVPGGSQRVIVLPSDSPFKDGEEVLLMKKPLPRGIFIIKKGDKWLNGKRWETVKNEQYFGKRSDDIMVKYVKIRRAK
jgi:hypothetical protein